MHCTGLLFAAAFALQSGTATASQHQDVKRLTLTRPNDASFDLRGAKKVANATPLTQAKTLIPLTPNKRSSASSGPIRNVLLADSNSPSLNAAESGAGYTMPIDFGGQQFTVIFDTGSSDLWVAQQGLQCVDYYGASLDISECGFGAFFNGSIEKITYQNFNLTYGDGETVAGTMDYQEVCAFGYSVAHQEVGLVDYAYWNGDGVTSGVMGFAYPSLTSAFEGMDPTKDIVNTTDLEYTNWLFNLIAQHSIDPLFTVALSRGEPSGPSGQLALGGLTSLPYVDDWATAPLQILELTPHASEAKNYSYYTIIPDGFILRSALDNATITTDSSGNSISNTTFPAIVDSGTTLMYLPVELAYAINSAFSPPAIFIENEGIFEAACNATPPALSVVIGGKAFEIDGRDLLLTNLGVDSDTGGCLSGVQPIDDLFILGDSFMKNVVSVFDIGGSQMRFAPRVKY